MTADQWIALIAGIVGGGLRVGVPFLFVSLGECLTEKSGRINLGLEGVLVLSAMASFGGAYLTGSAWMGVLAGAVAGGLLAALHGLLCSLDGVNDVATGIAELEVSPEAHIEFVLTALRPHERILGLGGA